MAQLISGEVDLKRKNDKKQYASSKKFAILIRSKEKKVGGHGFPAKDERKNLFFT